MCLDRARLALGLMAEPDSPEVCAAEPFLAAPVGTGCCALAAGPDLATGAFACSENAPIRLCKARPPGRNSSFCATVMSCTNWPVEASSTLRGDQWSKGPHLSFACCSRAALCRRCCSVLLLLSAFWLFCCCLGLHLRRAPPIKSVCKAGISTGSGPNVGPRVS